MHFVLLPTSDYRILSLKRYFWIVYVLVFIVASESSSPFIIEIIRFSASSHGAYIWSIQYTCQGWCSRPSQRFSRNFLVEWLGGECHTTFKSNLNLKNTPCWIFVTTKAWIRLNKNKEENHVREWSRAQKRSTFSGQTWKWRRGLKIQGYSGFGKIYIYSVNVY